jgi:hypothetical protein
MPQPRTRRRKNKKRTTTRKKRGGATKITSTHKTDNTGKYIDNRVDVGNSDPNDALKSPGFVSNVKSKFKMFPSLEQGNHIFKSFFGIPDTKIKRTEAHIVVNGEAESQQRQLFEAIDLGSFENDGFYKQIAALYKIKTGGTLDNLTMFKEYSETIPKEDSSKPKNNDDAPQKVPSFTDLLPDIYKNIPDAAVEQIMDSTTFKEVTEIYTKGDPTTYDNVRWAIVFKALSEEPDESKIEARKNKKLDQSLDNFLNETVKSIKS